MFKRRKTDSVLEQGAGADAVDISDVLQASSVDGEEIPRYPPFMRGLPAASVPRVMDTQKDMVDRLRQTLGLERSVFDEIVLPVLYRYVAFVHLLPASQAHHHRGAGGLLRHGLEVAFFAARASEGVVFVPFGTPRERHELEPRWHVAIALAGLLHDLGKSVADVGVTDRDGKSEWQPYLETLLEWARNQKVERYFLRWNERRHKRHEMYNKMVADRVLTPEVIQWLSSRQPEIARALFETITGANVDSDMYRLVSEADQKSVEADLKANHMPVSSSLGVPVEQHLLDAMRCLLNGGTWTVNERGARVWVLRDGAYIVWKQAAEEIVAFLAKDRVPGIPRSHDTLADILIERGIAKPRTLQNGSVYRYWPVSPSLLTAKTGEGVTLYMLKLGSPQILFSTEPEFVEAVIGDEFDRSSTKAATTAAELPNTTKRQDPVAGENSNTVANERKGSVGQAIESRGTHKADREASTPETNTSWFKRHGVAGEILLAMIRDLAADKTRGGETLVVTDQAVLIVYPDGVAPYGDSQKFMAALEEKGWIAVDPRTPLRKVRELGGARGLVLSDEPARRTRALVERSTARGGSRKNQPSGLDEEKLAPVVLPREIRVTQDAEISQRLRDQAINFDWPSGIDALATALLKAIVERSPVVGEVLVAPDGRLQVARRDLEAIASRAGVKRTRLDTRLRAIPSCSLEGDYLFVRLEGSV